MMCVYLRSILALVLYGFLGTALGSKCVIVSKGDGGAELRGCLPANFQGTTVLNAIKDFRFSHLNYKDIQTQCCQGSASTWNNNMARMTGGVCHDQPNSMADSNLTCFAKGGRLCELSELRGGLGCGWDNHMVWTTTPCDCAEFEIARVNMTLSGLSPFFAMDRIPVLQKIVADSLHDMPTCHNEESCDAKPYECCGGCRPEGKCRGFSTPYPVLDETSLTMKAEPLDGDKMSLVVSTKGSFGVVNKIKYMVDTGKFKTNFLKAANFSDRFDDGTVANTLAGVGVIGTVAFARANYSGEHAGAWCGSLSSGTPLACADNVNCTAYAGDLGWATFGASDKVADVPAILASADNGRYCGPEFRLPCPPQEYNKAYDLGVTMCDRNQYCQSVRHKCATVGLEISLSEEAVQTCMDDTECLDQGTEIAVAQRLECSSAPNLCTSSATDYRYCPFSTHGICQLSGTDRPRRVQLKSGDSLAGLTVYFDPQFALNGDTIQVSDDGRLTTGGQTSDGGLHSFNYYSVRCSAYGLHSGDKTLRRASSPTASQIWQGTGANTTSRCTSAADYEGGAGGCAADGSFKIGTGITNGIKILKSGWTAALDRGASYNVYCGLKPDSTSSGSVVAEASVTMAKFPAPSVEREYLASDGFVLTNSVGAEEVRCGLYNGSALGNASVTAADIWSGNQDVQGFLAHGNRRNCSQGCLTFEQCVQGTCLIAAGQKSSFVFGRVGNFSDGTAIVQGAQLYYSVCAKYDAKVRGVVASPSTSFYSPGFLSKPKRTLIHEKGVTVRLQVVGGDSLGGLIPLVCKTFEQYGRLVSTVDLGYVREGAWTNVEFSGLTENTTYTVHCKADFAAQNAIENISITTPLQCPGGTHNPDAGVVGTCDQTAQGGLSAEACVTYAGLYFWPDASVCRICDQGQFTPLAVKNFRCIACPSGRFLGDNATNATKHDPFSRPLGFVEEICPMCTAGQYQPTEGQAACMRCRPGTFMDPRVQGSRVECECQLCRPGTVQPGKGKTECDLCAPSYYEPAPGRTACRRCSSLTPISVGELNSSSGTYNAGATGEFLPPFVNCIAYDGVGPDPPDVSSLGREYDVAIDGIIFKWTNKVNNAKNVLGHIVEWSTENNFLDKRLVRSKAVAASATELAIPASCSNGTFCLLAHPHNQVTYFRLKSFTEEKGLQVMNDGTATTLPWSTTDDCKGGLKYLQTLVPVQNAHPSGHGQGTKKGIDSWECARCPPGGDCRAKGGRIWESGVRNMYGYWRTPHTIHFARCDFKAACLGQPNPALEGTMFIDAEFAKSQDEFKEGEDLATIPRNESCNHWLGHETNGNCFSSGVGGKPCRLCASCRLGYTLKASKRCSKCPDRGTTQVFLALMFFLMFLVVMGMVAMIVKSGGKEGISDAVKKILLNWMSVSALAANFSLRWPEALLQMFQWQSVVGNISEFASPDCEFSSQDKAGDFYKVLTFYAMLPIVVPLFFSFLWFVAARAKGLKLTDKLGAAQKFNVVDHVVLTNVVTLFLMYPTICNKTISLFACRRVGRHAYLDADLQEQCFVGRHLTMVLSLGVGQLVVWVFGLPALACVMMYRHRAELSQPNIGFRFGLLHHGYRLERFWWEAIVCFRKVCIIFIGLLGRMAPVEMQTHLALFTLFLFLVLHLYFVPYESAKGPLHIMESFALSVGWFTMWGGLLMYQLFNDPDVADKQWKIQAIQAVIISLNVACFMYLVGHLVREYAIEQKLEDKLGKCKGKINRKQRELDALEGINLKDLRHIFDVIDADKGGTIDHNELSVLLRMQGLQVSNLRVKSMIRNASETGEEELTFPEFCKIMAGASGDHSSMTDTLVRRMSVKLDPLKVDVGEESDGLPPASTKTLAQKNRALVLLLKEHGIPLPFDETEDQGTVADAKEVGTTLGEFLDEDQATMSHNPLFVKKQSRGSVST